MKTKRLEIKLEPKQYRELKKYARQKKVSMGDVVREGIDLVIWGHL